MPFSRQIIAVSQTTHKYIFLTLPYLNLFITKCSCLCFPSCLYSVIYMSVIVKVWISLCAILPLILAWMILKLFSFLVSWGGTRAPLDHSHSSCFHGLPSSPWHSKLSSACNMMQCNLITNWNETLNKVPQSNDNLRTSLSDSPKLLLTFAL